MKPEPVRRTKSMVSTSANYGPRSPTNLKMPGHKKPTYLLRLLNSRPFCWLLVIASFFTLFVGDLKMLFLPKSLDQSLSVIALLFFIVFTLDIVLKLITTPDYRRQYLVMLLDTMNALSLLLEVDWLDNYYATNFEIKYLGYSTSRLALRAGT